MRSEGKRSNEVEEGGEKGRRGGREKRRKGEGEKGEGEGEGEKGRRGGTILGRRFLLPNNHAGVHGKLALYVALILRATRSVEIRGYSKNTILYCTLGKELTTNIYTYRPIP